MTHEVHFALVALRLLLADMERALERDEGERSFCSELCATADEQTYMTKAVELLSPTGKVNTEAEA